MFADGTLGRVRMALLNDLLAIAYIDALVQLSFRKLFRRYAPSAEIIDSAVAAVSADSTNGCRFADDERNGLLDATVDGILTEDDGAHVIGASVKLYIQLHLGIVGLALDGEEILTAVTGSCGLATLLTVGTDFDDGIMALLSVAVDDGQDNVHVVLQKLNV